MIESALMTRIHLIRHGQTALNARGRFRGRADPPLDEVGREQALAAACAVESAGLTALYSSPLTRARETAEAVARRTSLTIRVMPELIDLDFGRWEGKTPAEAALADPVAFLQFRNHPHNAVIPGGESVVHLKDRLLGALELIAKEHPDGTVGAVTHEMVLRVALSEASGKDDLFWGRVIPTGSVWTVAMDGDDVSRSTSESRNVTTAGLDSE
jgi:broad specificity phosphatase PhoE